MTEPSQQRTIYIVALTTWAIAFIALLIQQWWFVESGFLYRDDGVYLPRTLHLVHISEPGYLWYLHLLGFLSSLSIDHETAVVIFKIFVLTLFACVPALLAVLLLLILGAPWLSAAVGLFIAGYPLAVDQGATYVAAAHPTYGAMVAIAALGVLWFSWGTSTARFLVGIISVAALAFLASFASPTLRLMVVAPIVWILVMSFFDWRGWKRSAIALLIVLLPLALRATHIADHHYAQMPGRVDMSLPTILGNAVAAVRMIFAPLATASTTVLLLYLIGFVLLAVGLCKATRSPTLQGPRRCALPTGTAMLALFILCVVTAALAFGPPSVLTVFRPRYVVPSFLLVALGISALVVWFLRKHNSKPAIALVISALVTLIGANLVLTGEMQKRQLGKVRLTHEAAMKLASNERHRWGEQSQIVLVVGREQRTPTNGSTHRSTWYLRFLSGNHVRAGLLGRVDMLGADPFVDVPGELRMRGLQEGVPLYLYEIDEKGHQFHARDVLFLGSNPAEAKFARFGEAPTSVTSGLTEHCEKKERVTFIWPMTPSVSPKAKPCRPEVQP